jgi:hypothetical protein
MLRSGGRSDLDWHAIPALHDDVRDDVRESARDSPFDRTPERATVVGRGTFATVLVSNRDPGRCIKIERVIGSDPFGAGANSLTIAERMGDVGIGPRVHAWRVVASAKTGSLYLASEMDRVDGCTLQEWTVRRARSTEMIFDRELATLDAALMSKVRRMNALGVRHNDLHLHNVMVDTTHTPWLIDFTFASQPKIGEVGDETAALLAKLASGRRHMRREGVAGR